jgi:acetyl/propionyl-CoA carboxylase alpha subunit
MEVNPRILVEHPVTEATTGIDIVEQQIKLLGDEQIPFSQ